MERKDTGSKAADIGFGADYHGEQGERTGDAEERTLKYRLYVGPLQDIPEGVEFSYYDSRRGFLFVLTDHKPDGKFAPMTEELMDELTDSEWGWYNKSCFILNARWIAAHEEESKEKVESFLADFETELKREVERMKGLADGRDQDPDERVSSTGD